MIAALAAVIKLTKFLVRMCPSRTSTLSIAFRFHLVMMQFWVYVPIESINSDNIFSYRSHNTPERVISFFFVGWRLKTYFWQFWNMFQISSYAVSPCSLSDNIFNQCECISNRLLAVIPFVRFKHIWWWLDYLRWKFYVSDPSLYVGVI